MSNEKSPDALAGSWIVDAGPGQMKTLANYAPLDGGKFSAIEPVINFDWTLGGAQPTATHGTSLVGTVETGAQGTSFILIAYALDANDKAVYIVKGTGSKVQKDVDTISVENLVMHFYTNPDANPVTDTADFTVPASGTFPPVREYRIK